MLILYYINKVNDNYELSLYDRDTVFTGSLEECKEEFERIKFLKPILTNYIELTLENLNRV